MRSLALMLMVTLAAGCGTAPADPGGDAATGGDGATGGDPTTSPVGAACTPESIPAGGYDGREVYIESGSASCETRACLVYQLDGDPRMLDCDEPGCVSSEEVAARTFCTCRCSSDTPGATLCTCPSGFSCIDGVVEAGGEGVRGGYCIRDGL